VDDVASMGVAERPEEVGQQRAQFGPIELGLEVLERPVFGELHREVRGLGRNLRLSVPSEIVVDRPVVEDLDDPGMVERGGRADFVVEVPPVLRSSGVLRSDEFDGDGKFGLSVCRTPDVAHRAASEASPELERTELHRLQRPNVLRGHHKFL